MRLSKTNTTKHLTDLNDKDKIKALENELRHLRQKEKDLEHDIVILKQILKHIHDQFENMKKELLKK